MIEKLTISALIAPNEMRKIQDSLKDAEWKQVSKNCKSTTLTRESGIERVSFLSPDETIKEGKKKYQYILFLVTITYKSVLKTYSEDIQKIMKQEFPYLRRIEFKVHYVRFGISIKDSNTKQYFEFLKHGFELKNRGMKRTIYNNRGVLILENEDSKVWITGDKELYISISLRKGKIQSSVRRYGFTGRKVTEILDAPYAKSLELNVMIDYLTAIIGKGDFYTLQGAQEAINGSQYSPKKKERLVQFVAELARYNDLETFLDEVEKGNVAVTKKRKTAMDYIRCLNEMGVNMLTLGSWNEGDNLSLLQNPVKLITRGSNFS